MGPARLLYATDLWDSDKNFRGHNATMDLRRSGTGDALSVFIRTNQDGNDGAPLCDADGVCDGVTEGCPLGLRELRVNPALPASPVLSSLHVYPGTALTLNFDPCVETAGVRHGLVREEDGAFDLLPFEAAAAWTSQNASIPLNDQLPPTPGWEAADDLFSSSRALGGVAWTVAMPWPVANVRTIASRSEAQHHPWLAWWHDLAMFDLDAVLVSFDDWFLAPNGIWLSWFTVQPPPWTVVSTSARLGAVDRMAKKAALDALWVDPVVDAGVTPRLAAAWIQDSDTNLANGTDFEVRMRLCADTRDNCDAGIGWEPAADALVMAVDEPAEDTVVAVQIHWVETRSAGLLRPSLGVVVETKESNEDPAKPGFRTRTTSVWWKKCVDFATVDWTTGWVEEPLFPFEPDIDVTLGPSAHGNIDAAAGGGGVSVAVLQEDRALDDISLVVAWQNLTCP